ncbi:MAG: GNAT family N-acetyltransferase [Candidatus Thorarchaeota archaeon]
MKTFDIGDYYIEQFKLEDPHGKDLIDLITSSFLNDEAAQSDGASIVFNEQTFYTLFGTPSTEKDFFVRAIDKKTKAIVGFLGTIPRNLAINGEQYKFAIPSWLAVHHKHQRKGIAKALGKGLLEIAKEKGYDGGFALHEPEQHGIDTSKAVARETNIPLHRLVWITKYVIRVFDVDKIASVVKLRWYEKLFFRFKVKIPEVQNSNIRFFKPDDIKQIYELIQDLVKRNQIAIVQEFKDIEWFFQNKNVLCIVHENNEGKIDGFITAWEFNLAGFGNVIEFGWLDMVHTYKLKNNEIRDLANFFTVEAKKKGWKGLQTPYIPYFDAKPFQKANFIFFPKKLSLDLFNIKNIPIPEKIDSFYFDWR